MGCISSATVSGHWLSGPQKGGRLENDQTKEEVATLYVLLDFNFNLNNDCGYIGIWSLMRRL